MLYKIQNFKPFVPYGAQYVNVIKEDDEIVTVDYWVDEEKRNPATGLSLQGLVLYPSELSEITAGKYELPDIQNRDYNTNYLVIEVDPKRDYIEIGEPFRIVEPEHEYRKGDIFRTVANDATNRTLVWVKVLKVLQEYDTYYEESTKPQKLKDTTKVAGQNKFKARTGDKIGKNKENDIYSSGDDIRGLRRYPHSKGEKEFDDIHKIKFADIIDHPANEKDWGIETITNKDIGNKFEDFAPLDSGNLHERVENAASMNSMDDYISSELSKKIDKLPSHIRSDAMFQRSGSKNKIEYEVSREYVGEPIYLRNWFLHQNTSDKELLNDANGKDNEDIYNIVKHIKSSGYTLTKDDRLVQYLSQDGVAKGGGVKVFAHNYIDRLENDKAAAITFKLNMTSDSYGLKICIYSKGYVGDYGDNENIMVGPEDNKSY